jgi:hypothetical protein
LAVAGTATPASAARMLIDFGGSAPTTHAAAPNDPVNYWNNVSLAVAQSNTATLSSFVTADNTQTNVGLSMTARFNAENTNGTTSSTVYPTNATSTSYYGNTEAFSTLSNVFPRFTITGLLAGENYAFTFYASRTGVSDNRSTVYTLTSGASSTTATLDVANNVNNTATASIAADSLGQIAVGLSPGAANNNANHFTYLSVLDISGNVPEPATGLLLAIACGGLLLRRRRSHE